jgi:hypothetical protein
MKRTFFVGPLRFLCAFSIFICSVSLWGGAPTAVGNLNITIDIKGGQGLLLANSGVATATFTPSGSFAFLDISGDIAEGQFGKYTYQKLNENTGRVIFSYSGNTTLSTEVMIFSFNTSLSGTFTSTATVGSITDDTFGTFTLGANDTNSPLVNISNLLALSPSQSVTAGFVIGGNIPRKVLVRAIGPALSGFGVTDYMATTQMSLFSGQESYRSQCGLGRDALCQR